MSIIEAAVDIVKNASYEAEIVSQGFTKYAVLIDFKSHIELRRFKGSEATKADFNDVGLKAVKGLITEDVDVVATMNTAGQRWNQSFYFFFYVIMGSVEPRLSKEVDMLTEDAPR